MKYICKNCKVQKDFNNKGLFTIEVMLQGSCQAINGGCEYTIDTIESIKEMANDI